MMDRATTKDDNIAPRFPARPRFARPRKDSARAVFQKDKLADFLPKYRKHWPSGVIVIAEMSAYWLSHTSEMSSCAREGPGRSFHKYSKRAFVVLLILWRTLAAFEFCQGATCRKKEGSNAFKT